MTKHIGKVFPTKTSGNLEVVSYINARNVEVIFLTTGHRATTQMSQIRSGKVKDPLHPSVFGVGFIGVGKYKVSDNSKITKAYQCWSNMLERCYSYDWHNIYPTYAECTVHSEWHNFQTFAKWYHENYPADCGDYHLDKDIKIDGNKEYSPIACTFVSPKDNLVKSHAKNYIFVSPDGVEVEMFNLSEFCRENNLNQGHMCQVNSGNLHSHKGWTKCVSQSKQGE